MSQQNIRKEPTFGQPSQPTENLATTAEKMVDNAEKTPTKQPISFSVHSTQSSGHTFTPLVKRSEAEQTAISNAAKVAMEQEKAIKAVPQAKVAPNLGFAFTPVEKEPTTESNSKLTATTSSSTTVEQQKTEANRMQSHQEQSGDNNLERVMPTQSQTISKKSSALEKISTKYRRLLLVLLLALALITIFFLLKPKTPETVEDFQTQGTSLPIEFRPLDEEEAKRAEEALQQQLEPQQAQPLQLEQTAATESTGNENTETQATEVTQPNDNRQQEATSVASESHETTVQPIVKPDVNGSVIHRVENQTSKTSSPAKTTTLKPVTSTTKVTSQPKASVETVKSATLATKKVETTPSKTANNTVANTTAKVASSKTITVQKGVSLFQNFRDNGLEANLPELNKMTKLNGATSRLNPGQKITVRLDKNNRIVEMNIGNGKYIRQADGNYIYR